MEQIEEYKRNTINNSKHYESAIRASFHHTLVKHGVCHPSCVKHNLTAYVNKFYDMTYGNEKKQMNFMNSTYSDDLLTLLIDMRRQPDEYKDDGTPVCTCHSVEQKS